MQECNKLPLEIHETVSQYSPFVEKTCLVVTTHVLVEAARSSSNVTEETYKLWK